VTEGAPDPPPDLEQALEHHRAGRLDEADALYRAFRDIHPDHADALHLHGLLAHQRGAHDEAAARIRRAIAGCPNIPIYHVSLGDACRAAGEVAAATDAYERALELAPGLVEAVNGLGLIAVATGALESAADRFREAARLAPERGKLHFNLANALLHIGAYEGADDAFVAALDRQPDDADALAGRGTIRRDLGDTPGAISFYRRALDARPGDGRLHSNLAVAIQQTGDLDGALEHFDTAIALAPDLAEAYKNRAMLLLLRGDFEAGFDGYEWRWRHTDPINTKRPFPQPAWDGGPLDGKTLLAWGEQGIGDEIMFSSLVPELEAAAAGCVLECDRRLEPLFRRSFPRVTVVARYDPPSAAALASDIDLQCATGDLCRWRRRHRRDFASPAAYLVADTERVAALRARYDRLGAGLKVGIAWRSKTPVWGAIKTAKLDQWETVLSQPGAVFVNLQYGDCAAELARAEACHGVVVHHDDTVNQMADLDAFAAQVAAMDLVVTTSNTTAHMAGALGVPSLVLLAHVPDWRWQATGDAALWYPRVRLIRQPRPGCWAEALEVAGDAVAARIAG
jgi:Flp pilus assembly protein TadD